MRQGSHDGLATITKNQARPAQSGKNPPAEAPEFNILDLPAPKN
jgi:hypothetical protein